MAGQFAGRLALIGFAAATVRGARARIGFTAAIIDALPIFFGLGWVLGEPARRLVEGHARRVRPTLQPAAERRTTGTG